MSSGRFADNGALIHLSPVFVGRSIPHRESRPQVYPDSFWLFSSLLSRETERKDVVFKRFGRALLRLQKALSAQETPQVLGHSGHSWAAAQRAS